MVGVNKQGMGSQSHWNLRPKDYELDHHYLQRHSIARFTFISHLIKITVVVFQDQSDERNGHDPYEESVDFMPLRFCLGKLYHHYPTSRQ
jgi:hypothetical protein